MAFGDSLVQGYGLANGDGFVPQLDRWLDAQGRDVEVINGGVSGETTAGGLRRLDWTIGDDVDAVLLATGGNDLLRGLPLDEVAANLDEIVSRIQARDIPVMLVGYRATSNFGAEYSERFNAIYPEVAETYGVVFHPYIFQGMADAMAEGQIDRTSAFQSDGIHPNAQGVALNIEAMGPKVLDLLDQVTAPGT
ncbi:arylesterase [Maritimibacter dapengensis]|nr:arylesterase [Maritimibacter dapengensis]